MGTGACKLAKYCGVLSKLQKILATSYPKGIVL